MEELTLLKELVDNYVKSVNNMDLDSAKNLWIDNENISFIHPRGHEVGINNILDSFYINTMGKFSSRNLIPKDIDISILGNTAIVIFYWDFYATFAEDNEDIDTHGRETQIYIKVDGKWKLSHIHYSSMPMLGDKEGF